MALDGVADRMCPVLFILFPPCSANAGHNTGLPKILSKSLIVVHEKT